MILSLYILYANEILFVILSWHWTWKLIRIRNNNVLTPHLLTKAEHLILAKGPSTFTFRSSKKMQYSDVQFVHRNAIKLFIDMDDHWASRLRTKSAICHNANVSEKGLCKWKQ